MKSWKKHSDYFNQSDATITHGTNGTVILTEKLRNALSFRITAIETYVNNGSAWGKLLWHLNCNGVPVSPFDNQKTQIGQSGLPQEVIIDFIFPPASVMSVSVDNIDGVNDWVGGIVLKGEYGTFTD